MLYNNPPPNHIRAELTIYIHIIFSKYYHREVIIQSYTTIHTQKYYSLLKNESARGHNTMLGVPFANVV